jgi:Rhodanese-like domain
MTGDFALSLRKRESYDEKLNPSGGRGSPSAGVHRGGAMAKSTLTRREVSSIRRITPAEARALVEEDRAVLVDTRERRFFEEAHARGAISVPLADIERNPRGSDLGSIPEDRAIILYCT